MLKGQSFLVSKVGSKFWWLPCFPAVFHPGQTFCTWVYSHRSKTFNFKIIYWPLRVFWTFHRFCRLSGRKIEIHGYFWQQMWQVLERGHTTCFLAWVIFSLVFLSENLTIFLSVFVHSMIKYCSKVKAVPLDT